MLITNHVYNLTSPPPDCLLAAALSAALIGLNIVIIQYIYHDSLVKKADSGVADSQIPFLAVEPESYKVFLDPKLYAADGTVPKHDVDYDGRVEVIFRPKTDTSVISLHVGLLKIDGDPMLKRRLSMDTPTDQVLKVKDLYFFFTYHAVKFGVFIFKPSLFINSSFLIAYSAL